MQNLKPGKICAVCLLSLFLLSATSLKAQDFIRTHSDTNYIRSYDTLITSRIYLSQKYVSLRIKDRDTSFAIRYRPNSKMYLGIGASYGWLTLNLSAGLGIINWGDKGKEKPKALDLQIHFYTPKFTLDFLGQRYKGFYLYPSKTATEKNWYNRPDLIMTQVGVSGFYALNWRRFSYRAAYQQNEWQVKSAGSILVGGEVYYEKAKADSAFVPGMFRSSYSTGGVQSMEFVDIGPGVGYGYTLVIAKHWFLSGAVTSTLSVNWMKEETDLGESDKRFALNPNFTYKAGLGYNSHRFTTSLTWVNNDVVAASHNAKYKVLGGNARFRVAWRFDAGPKLKRNLRLLRQPPLSLIFH